MPTLHVVYHTNDLELVEYLLESGKLMDALRTFAGAEANQQQAPEHTTVFVTRTETGSQVTVTGSKPKPSLPRGYEVVSESVTFSPMGRA